MTIFRLTRSFFSRILHVLNHEPASGHEPACGHSKPTGPDDIAGGQAVIEGVMMRHGNRIAVAVRSPAKDIVIKEQDYIPFTKRYPVLGIRVVRGSVTLVEMMILGIKTLLYSAEVAMPEGEKKPQGWEIALSLCLSFSMALTLFVLIPAYCFAFLRDFIENTILLNIVEGMIRLGIFLAFLTTTLLMEDMRRVFMYHGAEHKSIFAFESGVDLVIDRVRDTAKAETISRYEDPAGPGLWVARLAPVPGTHLFEVYQVRDRVTEATIAGAILFVLWAVGLIVWWIHRRRQGCLRTSAL